jgi:TonB family protein
MNRAGISRIAFAVTLTLGLPALASAQLAPNATTARAMKLERFVAPEFPPFLRQAGILQGTVVVAIGHDIRGKVNDTLVLESSDPRFTAATLDAIREWRFEAKPASTPMLATTVPVVRFLFTTGSVSMVSLTASGRTGTRQSVRAETPIELPNFSHLDETPRALSSPAPEFPPALRSRNAQGACDFQP